MKPPIQKDSQHRVEHQLPVIVHLQIGMWVAFVFAYNLLSCWKMYAEGYYRYYDLVLINDFISCKLLWGQWFWVPELQQTHLSTHFTPTLARLAPLYLIFDSGFLLLVLSNLALHIALWQLLRWTFKETFSTLEFFPQWITRWLLPPLLAVGLGTNLFFRAVVSSGHFEVFATSLAIFALTWLWNERTRGPGVAAFVLALGVRQDAALFLFFALAALMVMQWRSPQQTRAPIRTQLALLSLCPAWLILCVKILIPAAGGSGSAFAARYWSHYGETWPAVALAMLTQPQRLLHDLADSGFTRLFDSVAYLPALNPAAWLVSLPPAALLFTALDADKAMLCWYNSAFLLPSVLILSLLGWIRFVRFVQCIPSHGFWSFIRLKTALALSCAAGGCFGLLACKDPKSLRPRCGLSTFSCLGVRRRRAILAAKRNGRAFDEELYPKLRRND